MCWQGLGFSSSHAAAPGRTTAVSFRLFVSEIQAAMTGLHGMGIYSNKESLSYLNLQGRKIKNDPPQRQNFPRNPLKQAIFPQNSLSRLEFMKKNLTCLPPLTLSLEYMYIIQYSDHIAVISKHRYFHIRLVDRLIMSTDDIISTRRFQIISGR